MKEVFGKDDKTKEEESKIRPPKKEAVKEDIHEGKPFFPGNPGKRGQLGTIKKFPEHIPDPPKIKKYVKPPEDAPEPPPGFKATYKYMTRPSPSIATNYRNLKSSFPSAFSRSPVR